MIMFTTCIAYDLIKKLITVVLLFNQDFYSKKLKYIQECIAKL